MYDKNLNWYKEAQLIENICREAGFKEFLSVGIIAAVISVLSGSTIFNAAEHNNVSEEELNKALSNKEIINRAQYIMKRYEPNQSEKELYQTLENISQPQQSTTPPTPSKNIRHNPNKSLVHYKKDVKQPTTLTTDQPTTLTTEQSIDQIIHVLLDHENLLPGQTPFRITNPKMRQWNTILGFEINKSPNAPENRRNFLYLKNPNEVNIAVKKLLERYKSMPSRYGLKDNPTLADALKKFDQSNSVGKISYLKAQIPNLNVNQLLENFF